MEAKVRDDHRWRTVMAFGGVEFVKGEYRKVPAGSEKAAQAHPFLEIKGGEPEGEPKHEKTPEERAAFAKKMKAAKEAKKAGK